MAGPSAGLFVACRRRCCRLPPSVFLKRFFMRTGSHIAVKMRRIQQTVDGFNGALEIVTRSSYVLSSPIGVRSRFPAKRA
jgi:hypothetical protein